jgi:hypothetical protein
VPIRRTRIARPNAPQRRYLRARDKPPRSATVVGSGARGRRQLPRPGCDPRAPTTVNTQFTRYFHGTVARMG